MTAANPLAAPEAWNEVAEGYTAELLPLFSLYAADALAMAELPPGAHVVDVAAGPGTLSLLAARRAERVAAVDFSDEMVRVLARRAAEAGLHNVEVHQADGQSLPFGDAEFDAGFSMFGLIFFPDRAAGFRELLRVLRPGGRAVVSSWVPAERVPLLAALFAAVRDLLPGFPFGGGGGPLAEAEDFRAEMSAAGFRHVEIRTVRHSLEIPSVREFWRVQERSSAPIALLRKKHEAHEWEAFRTALVARLEREFGAGPLQAGWEAHLGTGVR